MPFKPTKKLETVEGVVDQTYRTDYYLFFDLEGKNHKLFYSDVKGARVDSGDRVRLHLTGIQMGSDGTLANMVTALEILTHGGSLRFTYISGTESKPLMQDLGKWEW